MILPGLLWVAGKWMFRFNILMALLLAIDIALPRFQPGIEVGCYTKNAMISYVECVGFPGSQIVGVILSLPLLTFLPPQIAIELVVEGDIFDQPGALAVAVVVTAIFVLGLIWPIWWLVRRSI